MSSGIADPLPAPVTKTEDDYVRLITPWQSTKAKFVATVRVNVAPHSAAQVVIASLPAAFDVDYAVGAQLDVDGEWVGRSRNVLVPIPVTYFSFGVTGAGWNEAFWKGPYDTTQGISQLPDSLYRPLLYTKIAANSWDGTTDSAEAILRTYFTDPATNIFIDDGARAIAANPIFSFGVQGAGWSQGVWQTQLDQSAAPIAANIEYTACFSGKLPDRISLYVLANDLIPIKSAGATVTYAVVSVNNAPMFGFGMDNGLVSGFGKGAWGVAPATVAQTLS